MVRFRPARAGVASGRGPGVGATMS